MTRLGTETAFEVLVRARALEAQGRDIIHLEIGEPDCDTPRHIVEAGQTALGNGWTHYGPTQGQPELREAIAAYLSRTRGLKADAARVCVVPGGKPVIFYTLLAVLEPGDEVLYPNPSFPIYESMIRYCGATPVPVPLLEDRGFSFDLDVFRSKLSDSTRLVILNSPANPTGGVMPEEDIRELGRLLVDRDVIVLSDEIYSRMSYSHPAVSIATMPGMFDKTVILDGFSKTYAMTGWRIGYGHLPEWLVDPVNKLMVNSNSCTASFTQRAALAALEGDQAPAEAMIAEFRRRRDVFIERLNAIEGFRCAVPEGAFYAFPNIQGTGWGSKPLADALLTEAGVACLSGTAFGAFGEGYLRLSYANSMENLERATSRIAEFLNTRKTG
jgi:aspartate aminotransferase